MMMMMLSMMCMTKPMVIAITAAKNCHSKIMATWESTEHGKLIIATQSQKAAQITLEI